ncbi:MAG: PAS domain S-box protein [Candidatus Omnitrophica bacterium]|nr:PAS domain S-box protein [Candidatus Omnitrophota bacterium]
MKKKGIFYFNLSTVDHIGVGFFKYSLYPVEKFFILNNAFAQILGYTTRKELKKEDFFSFFVNKKEKEEFLNLAKQKGKVKLYEAFFRRKDRKKLWVAITASYVESRSSYTYIEGIIQDISSHKEMEEKLALERDFLQSLLDNVPDAVYFKDDKNRIVKVNEFYAKGIGLKPVEIIGKTDFDFFPYKQAKQMFENDNDVLRTGKPIIGKIEATLLPDGSWNRVSTTKIPMYDRKRKIIGTMGITRDITAYAHLEKERLDMVMDSLQALTKALEMRDPYTSCHASRVASLSEIIAKELGWDEERILAIRLSAELHDIGKIAIPIDILTKPGNLTAIEYQMVQSHVENCYQLLKDVKSPFPLAQIVYQHHERLDGSGYPNGLKGDEIVTEARILAVTDVLESMTHRRPYREALGVDKAVDELKKGSGSKYDERIVDLVCKIIEENGFFSWLNA